MTSLLLVALLYFPQGGEVRVRAEISEGDRFHLYRGETLIHVRDEVVPGILEVTIPGTRCGAWKLRGRMSMDDGAGVRVFSEGDEVTVVASDANCDGKLNGLDGVLVIRGSLGLPIPLDGDL